jgi:hypothetical protein
MMKQEAVSDVTIAVKLFIGPPTHVSDSVWHEWG